MPSADVQRGIPTLSRSPCRYRADAPPTCRAERRSHVGSNNLLAVLDTRPPIARLATAVSDGDYVNNIRCDRVHDREREPAKHEVAQLVVQPRAQFRVIEQQPDHTFDFIGEAKSELRYLKFVPRSGLV